MYRTKEHTQQRKDAKRQMILDVAAKVFSAKGYHNTTITDIVEAANVSVGSMYFYFKNKEELFAELFRNISEQFSEVISSVLDVENFSVQKNFTRVMTASLWMYEKKRDIAKILLSEAQPNESLRILEKQRMNGFVDVMTEWFAKFKLHEGVNIPSERVAALMYASSYNALVSDWLAQSGDTRLIDCGYAFCIYNLQALRIPFEDAEIRIYIEEVIKELKNKKDTVMDKSKRKELMDSYKQREQVGGIYCITCTANGHKWTYSTVDLESIKNRYDFAIKNNGYPDPPMRDEWLKYGSGVFTFEVLSELKKKDTQSSKEFADDIDALFELWLEESKKEG